MRSALGIALVATGLTAVPAAADVLCRSQPGRVFVRAACKQRETSVALPKGPTGDPGAAAPTPVRVVDSTGRQVGLFAEPGYPENLTRIVFEVGAHLVSYVVGPARIGVGEPVFYHLVADCSDQRLLAVPRTDAFVRSGVVDATRAYYPADPIATQTPGAREFLPDPTCEMPATTLPNGFCCLAIPSDPAPYAPAEVAFELSTFAPPFRLEP